MAAKQIPAPPGPPAGLAARGKALWRSIHQDYELDALETELLTELCRVVDRCDVLEKELEGAEIAGDAGIDWAVADQPAAVRFGGSAEIG